MAKSTKTGWRDPALVGTIAGGVAAFAIMAAGIVLVIKAPPPKTVSYESLDPYDAGMAAYLKGDFQSALIAWTPLAPKDPRAQVGLGDIYYYGGGGVPADPAQALVWYYKAGISGNRWGELALAKAMLEDKGVKQDYAAANYWYRNAGMHGVGEAAFMAGTLTETGKGIRADIVETAAWYDISAELGYPDGAAERDRVLAAMTEAQRTMYRVRVVEFRRDLKR